MSATDLVPDIIAVGDSVFTDEDTTFAFNPLINDSFISTAAYTVSNTEY